MAEIIEEGFVVSYEVLKIGIIKPGASGEYQGTKYKASVKFRAVNISQQDDKDVGLREIEQIIEFSIPCDSEIIATNVSESLRKSRNNGVVIHIKGAIARMSQGADIYKVTSIQTGTEFLKGLSPKETKEK